MGFAYAEMIAPAILYAYPGISREEFAEKLTESSKQTGWPSSFQNGVRSLAGVLDLPTTESYRDSQQFSKDQYGLPLQPPVLEVDHQSGKLIVKVHHHNIRGRRRYLRFKGNLWGFREGQYFEYDKAPFNSAFVQKIIEQQPLAEDSPYFNSKIQITPFRPVGLKREYETEQALATDWPQFAVDNMYNFNQTEGRFNSFLGSENFWWRYEDSKFYLHPRTLDSIPASRVASRESNYGLGFVDLVLTAEVLKKLEWEVLEYKLTWARLNQFYDQYPEVLEIVNIAIWDAHTSLAAKRNGLSTRDFLSARAVGFRY